jgi:hypothetical protein
MSERLILKDTQIVKLSQYPGEDTDTQVLGVRALLTRPLAQHLGCHDNCFGPNGLPRHFVDLKLTDLVIENCEVDLDGQVLLASKVQNFKVGRPSTQSESDASLEVTCNLHFTYSPFLSDWAHRRNKGQFGTTLTPPATWNAQASLFDKADPDTQEDAGEGGDQSAAEQTPVSENLQGDNAVSGVATAAPPLASAREAAGGTHQRKRGKVTDIGVGAAVN